MGEEKAGMGLQAEGQAQNHKMHYVVATAIIIKEGKYLITKRAPFEKAFPNQWTVPGGKLESKDFTSRKKDAKELWYNVIEGLVEREVMEEVGLEVHGLKYLTNLSYIRSDGVPTIILSLFADHKEGEVRLCPALTEHAWVSLEEAKGYDLIDGIYDELAMLDGYLKNGSREKWKRH